jgi:hypothetical protein
VRAGDLASLAFCNNETNVASGECGYAMRQMLRHTVATLAYRGGKAVRHAPAGFAAFRIDEKIVSRAHR